MANMMEYKPTLVLMAGFPGTGKTTIAAKLGRSLHWPVLDKDLLKLTLLNQKLDLEPVRVGNTAYELLFSIAEDIVRRQQLSAILDTAAIHPFILKCAITIARSANARLKVILCIADNTIRNERLSKRPSPDLSTTSPINHAVIKNEFQYFKHLPADTLILETAYPLEDCLQSALQYVSLLESKILL
jgi:predicted kinase